MWLPTPVYERIPHFYFLAGLLLMADGLYLGFDYAVSFYYIGFGFLSSTYGVAIRVLRSRYRQARTTIEAVAPDADESAVDVTDTNHGSPLSNHSAAL